MLRSVSYSVDLAPSKAQYRSILMSCGTYLFYYIHHLRTDATVETIVFNSFVAFPVWPQDQLAVGMEVYGTNDWSVVSEVFNDVLCL